MNIILITLLSIFSFAAIFTIVVIILNTQANSWIKERFNEINKSLNKDGIELIKHNEYSLYKFKCNDNKPDTEFVSPLIVKKILISVWNDIYSKR